MAATPEAWAARMQELLVTLHAVLDVVMVGLEDGKLVATCRFTPLFLSHRFSVLASALVRASTSTASRTAS